MASFAGKTTILRNPTLRHVRPRWVVGEARAKSKDHRRNNCRLLDVEHVFNVLGTMESCPTYFCLSPNPRPRPSRPEELGIAGSFL